MSEMREKEALECGKMHIWALKPQSFQGPGPKPQIARFATSATFEADPSPAKSQIRIWHIKIADFIGLVLFISNEVGNSGILILWRICENL